MLTNAEMDTFLGIRSLFFWQIKSRLPRNVRLNFKNLFHCFEESQMPDVIGILECPLAFVSSDDWMDELRTQVQ